jgi:cysteine desulfurase
MHRIYLDHNATTPLLPGVAEAMRPFWTEICGNAASAHADGRRARQALENARDTVARALDADPREVIFTSGGTEANNLAILGLAGDPPGRIIASPIEHPSVAEPVEALATDGYALNTLPVSAEGVVPASALERTDWSQVRLVTVMLANNETGAIQPVRELAACCPGNIPFHCDAVQAVGKVPVSFRQLGVSTLSLSGHKFNGPKGIGALLVRQGTLLRPLIRGGHQQHGLRPGTEAIPLAVGLAAALDLACRDMAQRQQHTLRLRQAFLVTLTQAGVTFALNGPPIGGLPGTLNLSFPGCRADVLLIKLDLAGVCCSTGSACSSGSLLPSPVLRAMQVPEPRLHSAIRFSFSHLQREMEVVEAALRTAAAVLQLAPSSSTPLEALGKPDVQVVSCIPAKT